MSFENGQVTSETIVSRNLRIRSQLDAGILPILPFEKRMIELQLEEVKAAQDAMGQELGLVNHQGSETWHDNFAANQIEWDSHVVSKRGGMLVETLENALEMDYPPDGDELTLGSLMEVRFPGDKNNTQAILTGKITTSDESLKLVIPEDMLFITLKSPIGLALLGAKSGEKVSYGVNGRQLEVDVISVTQFQAA